MDLPMEASEACDHHWSHRHVPGLLIWLVTCDLCGDPNVSDMNQQVRDVQQPVRAWARKLREHAEVTSWPWALRHAALRLIGRH